MGELRSKMYTALLLRNYSKETIKSYLFCVKHFAKYFNKSPRDLGSVEIKEYFKYLVEEKEASCSLQRQTRAGLRFLYESVLNREGLVKDIPIARRRGKPLPQYLTPKEVKRFFKAIKDPRHLMMLEIVYATGVRTGELVKLKVKTCAKPIDTERKNYVRKEEWKNNKILQRA